MENKKVKGFRICSFNCNGINDFKKRKDIFEYLRNKDANIFFLQETHLPLKQENFIRSNWGYSVWLAGSETNRNGVAILFNNNFEHKVHKVLRDDDGHFLLLDIEFLHKRITLANIYGPSAGDNPDFLKLLGTKLEEIGNDKVIMGGDWNVVLNHQLDTRSYSAPGRPKARRAILDLMEKYDLIDVFRTLYPTQRKYTWRKFNSIKQGRLDYFLISDQLLSEISGTSIGESYRSDHSVIDLTLKKQANKRDRQFWKFNNSLLKDKHYIEKIKDVILELKKDYALPVYNFDNINEIPNDMLQFSISDQLFFRNDFVEDS